MKKLILSLFLVSFSLFSFAQNKPQFIVEQSATGYDVILSLENFSHLSSIKIEGLLKQNNFSEALNIDLDIMDVKYKKAFTSFGNDNIHAEFNIIITDDEGNVTRYPTVDLNILKES